MSKQIDERIVSMQFDNAKFESGVKQSLSTIDRLKKALHFDDVGSKGVDNLEAVNKGLKKIGKTAESIDMSPLIIVLDEIKVKFSALQVSAATAIANITNSAIAAGKNIASSFTIDPIKTGFQEYETQINAVQTILANTSKDGTTLKQVNAALDELNTYADKTIYNFTEMTRNIGTFTAAGLKLDTSVKAIQGIANLAAVSGSNSQQASTAMYQLSQALSSGVVQLMDWNSVVNAGMGGRVFQDAIIETASHFDSVNDSIIQAYKSGESFRSLLNAQDYGAWFTSDILAETLQKFTKTGSVEYISQLYGISKEAVLSLQEMGDTTGYNTEAFKNLALSIAGGNSEIANAAVEILSMANTAENAATKVKTFTQLMDTLKEACQSGWTATWELIVGDFDQSQELWTNLSDKFGALISASADKRNALLGGALKSNWEKLIDQINDAGTSTEEFETKLSEVVERNGESVDDLVIKYGSLQKAFEKGGVSSEAIKMALDELSGVNSKTVKSTDAVAVSTENLEEKLSRFQSIVDDVWKGSYGNTTERYQKLSEAGYDYAKVQELVNKSVGGHRLTLDDLGESMDQLSDSQLEAIGYTEQEVSALRDLAYEARRTNTPLSTLIDNITKPSGRDLLFDSLTNIIDIIVDLSGAISKAWESVFTPMTSDQLYSIIEGFHNLTESLKPTPEVLDQISSVFAGFFSILKIVATFVGGALTLAFQGLTGVIRAIGPLVLDIAADISSAITAFQEFITSSEVLSFVINGLTVAFGLVLESIKMVINFVKETYDTIKEWVAAFVSLDTVTYAVDTLKSSLSSFCSFVTEHFSKLGDIFTKFADSLSHLNDLSLEDLKEVFKEFGTSLLEWFLGLGTGIGEAIGSIGTFVKTIFSAAFDDILERIGITKETFKQLVGVFTGWFSNVGVDVNDLSGSFSNLCTILSDKLSVVREKFKGVEEILSQISEWLWDRIPTVVTLGLGFSVIDTINRFASVLEKLSAPIDLLQAVKDGIDAISKSLSNFVKAKAFKERSEGIKELAIAIGILAAACFVLAQIDTDKLIKAVGVMAALMTLMAALTVAVSKLSGTIGNIKGAAAVFIALSAAILILVKALDEMNTAVDNAGSYGDLIKNIGLIVVLMTTLVGSAAILSKIAPKLSKSSITLLLMASSIKMMVSAIKSLSDVEFDDVSSTLSVLVGTIAMMGVLGVAMSKLKVGSTLGLLAMVLSLKAFVNALESICEMDQGKLQAGMKSIAEIIVAFSAVMIATHFAGDNAAKAGVAVASMLVSLNLLVITIRTLSKINKGDLQKAINAISQLMLVMGAVMAMTHFAGENAIKAGTMLLMMTGAITIMAGLVVLLKEMDPDGLDRALGVITRLSVIFGAMIGLTHFANDIKGTLIGLTVAVTALGGMVAALSFLNQEKLRSASVSLSLVMGMFAVMEGMSKFLDSPSIRDMGKKMAVIGTMLIVVGAMTMLLRRLTSIDAEAAIKPALALTALVTSFGAGCVAIGRIGSVSKSALVGVGAMTLVMTAMTGILKLMDFMNIDNALECAQSLSLLIISLSGACTLLAIAGRIGSGAAAGATQILTVIGIVSAIILAVGAAIAAIPGGIEFIDQVGVALEKLGYALGSLFGGIVGGITAGATSGLPAVGLHLAAFMTNAKPFFDNMGSLNSEAVSAVARLGSMLAMLAGAHFLDRITSIFSGEGSMESFARQLPIFGRAMVDFSNQIKGIDSEAVSSVASAGKMLVEMASTIPNAGGLLSKIVGDNTLDMFSMQLIPFGRAMVDFSNTISGKIDSSAVESAANAGKLLAEMATAVPNSGNSLLSFIVGDNTLDIWGDQLVLFGRAMCTFSNTVAGNIDVSAVESASAAGSIMASLSKEIPNTGGLLGLLMGNNDLDTFGKQLPIFGRAMVDFSNSVAGKIDQAAVESAASAGAVMTALAKEVPPSGWSLSNIFAGNDDLDAFAKQIVKFGEGIVEFSSTLSNGSIDTNAVSTAVSAGTSVVDMLKQLSAKGMDVNVEPISKALTDISEMLNNFSKDMVGKVNVTTVTSAAETIDTIATAVRKIPKDVNLDTVSGQLGTFADGLVVFSNRLNSASSINFDVIDDAATAGVKIGRMVSSFDADVDISGYFSNLDTVASGIVSFSDIASKGVNLEGINLAIIAGTNIAGMLEQVSSSGLDLPSLAAFSSGARSVGSTIVYLSDILGSSESAKQSLNKYELENMASSIGSFASNFNKIEPIDTTVISNFKSAINLLTKAMISASELASGEFNTETLTHIASSIGDFGTNINKIPVIDTENLTRFSVNVPMLGTSLKNFSANVGSFDSDKVTSASSCLNDISEMIKKIPIGINWDLVDEFKSNVGMLGTAICNFAGSLTSDINAESISTAVSAGQDIAKLVEVVRPNSTIPEFTAGLNSLAGALKSFVTKMEGIDTSGAVDKMNSIRAAATELANSSITAISEKINSSTGDISNLGSQMATALQNGFMENCDSKMATSANAIINSLKNALEEKKSSFSSEGKELMSELASGINSSESKSRVKTAADNIAQAGLAAAKDLHTEFFNAGSYLVDGFASGISSNGAANEAATSMANSAMNATKYALKIYSPSRAFFELGGYVAEGFANGISNNEISVSKTATSMAKGLLSTVKNVLGIHSPSKATYTIGEYIAKGLENGMNDSQGDVEKSAEDLGDAATDGIENKVSSLGDALSRFSGAFKKRYEAVVPVVEKVGSIIKKSLSSTEKAAEDTAKAVEKVKVTKEDKEHAKEMLESMNSSLRDTKDYLTLINSLASALPDGALKDALPDFSVEDLRGLNALSESKLMDYSSAYNEQKAIESQREAEKEAQESKQRIADMLTDMAQSLDESRLYVAAMENLAATLPAGALRDAVSEMDIDELERVLMINSMSAQQREQYTQMLEQQTEMVKAQQDARLVFEDQFWVELLRTHQNGVDAMKYQDMSLQEFQDSVLSELSSSIEDYKSQWESTVSSLMSSSSLFKQSPESFSMISGDEMEENLKQNLGQLKLVDDGLAKLEENFKGKYPKLMQYLRSLGKDGTDIIVSMTMMSQEQLEELAVLYENGYQTAGDYATETLKGSAEEIEKQASEMLGGVQIDFQSLITDFDGTLASLETLIKQKSKGFKEAGAGVAKDFAAGIEENSQIAVNKAVAMAQAALSAARAALGVASPSRAFAEVGKMVCLGFANGITENLFMPQAMAIAMAEKARQSAASALGVHSPSTVFYGIGKNVVQGFGNALSDGREQIYNEASGMANSSIDGLSKAMSKVGNVIDSDMDIQPTIRPVLDLSDVTRGAGSIDDLLSGSPSMSMLSNVSSISRMMGMNQNGYSNADIIDAIRDLGRTISSSAGDTYNIEGITYDDGTNISEAVKTLVRAARVERRR